MWLLEESRTYIPVVSRLPIFGSRTNLECLESELQFSIILGFVVAAGVRALPVAPVAESPIYFNYTAPCSSLFFGGCCPPSAADNAYKWGQGCLFLFFPSFIV